MIGINPTQPLRSGLFLYSIPRLFFQHLQGLTRSLTRPVEPSGFECIRTLLSSRVLQVLDRGGVSRWSRFWSEVECTHTSRRGVTTPGSDVDTGSSYTDRLREVGVRGVTVPVSSLGTVSTVPLLSPSSLSHYRVQRGWRAHGT